MSRYSMTNQAPTWEGPAHEPPAIRRYLYITPFGQALGDLVALVAYGLVGGLTLGVVTLLVLTALAEWSFWASWRWAVLAGMIPLALMGLVVLRSILALATAMLERILGVDLDQSGEVGDVPTEVRLIPIRRSSKLIEGTVDPIDLALFIKAQQHRGSGQKAWRGVRLPSGRRCDDRYHTQMIQALERAGVWQGRGPRTAGRLLGDPDEVIRLLGLDGDM